jgi:hypothetical protein
VGRVFEAHREYVSGKLFLVVSVGLED